MQKRKSVIEEFEKTYSPAKSLWWYTCQSFVYRILNKALRTPDLRVLIVFRFLIKDIYEQLKQEQNKQSNSNVSVFYRGQDMTKDELAKIQSSVNEFISMRNFLSTTTDRRVAESFAHSCNSSNFEKVFFEIHAKHSTLTPFALISELSYFKSENEVLFMLGCIFRIESVEFDDKINMWIVKQDDHDLKKLFDCLKCEIGNETNYYSLAIILRKMGESHHAEECLKQQLLQRSSLSHDSDRCYHALGNIYQDRGNLEQALVYHKYSLDLKLKFSSKDYANIGNSYNSIGADYEKRGDYSLALRSYEKARQIWLKCYNDKHERLATIYNNLGIISRKLNNSFQAVENHTKALTIRQVILPENHPDIASSYTNLATVYMDMKYFDHALYNYQIALDIQQKSLSSNHKSLALTLYNIGSVYEIKNEYQLAIDYYLKAIKIYHHAVSATHAEFIQTEEGIKRCKANIK
jgi:tetratricopeptide (TPR) repeat protein